MADNPLKRLAASVGQNPVPKRVGKANHTLYLSEPQFSQFAQYLRANNKKPSEIVDQLIAMFLEEVKDDLPPDLSVDKTA